MQSTRTTVFIWATRAPTVYWSNGRVEGTPLRSVRSWSVTRRALLRRVIGMLGPGDEADDVGQETFIRFYRSMHHFRGEAVLRTYLTRIAMNLSLNALKGRKRQSVRVRIEDRAVSAVAAATQDTEHRGPEAEVEILETQRAVRAAIDGLEVKHRLVVVLRMIEGLSTKETAKALRVPEGTVLSRLSRAMKKLEADLGAWMDVDD